MKNVTFLPLLLIFFFLTPSLKIHAKTDPYVRMPALNKDGSQVLFTYQGDIWTISTNGGEARRLTGNKANDTRPVWSPDNNSISFSSDRYGNYDIYVLPLNGDPVKRLTYHSEHDIINSWRDDKIYFTSERFFPQVERENEMMTINQAGGTPSRFVDAVGYEPVPSPDQRFIAFVRGSCRPSREAYKGAANRNIWLYDTKNDSYQKLTSFEGNDFNPKWKDNQTLLFISSRTGKYNIHQLQLTDDGGVDGEAEALTDYSDEGIRSFSISANGEVIAFERKTSIYIKKEGEKAGKLNITLPLDNLLPDKDFKEFKNKVSQYKVSPDGKYIAFLIQGNLFLKFNNKEGSFTRTLAAEASRIKSFDWASENSIIYSSDKHNQYDLFLLESQQDKSLMDSHKFDHHRLTKTTEDETGPVVSPDKKSVAYKRGNGILLTAEIQNKALVNSNQLLEGWAEPADIAWSPDNKWLAYSKRDLNGNREIFIHKADGASEPVNVSMHPRLDSNPVWSHDKLAFISDRNNNDRDIWFVWLNEEDFQRSKREWKKMELADTTKVDSSEIKIDFKDIHERLVQVTGLPGNESDVQISKDGKRFYFVTNRDDRRNYKAHNNLFTVKWNGAELKPLAQGSNTPYRVRIGPQDKNLYMILKGGELAKVSLKKKKLEKQPFKANVEIDYRKQREQIFDEAWRALDSRFYDPDFHGRDWQKLRKTYKSRAVASSTKLDFQYTFNLMLGQVNASHMGLRGVKPRYETPKTNTGLLGIDIQPLEEGILVKDILENVPASREESRLQKGDLIVNVDGQAVSVASNFYQPLNNKSDETVILVIERDGKEMELVIRPVKSVSNQLYDDWVEERKELTAEYSDGKLGYIHIRGMNWNSFERFERELAATAYDKEGLVIDVRFNGGGWTTDYLMTILDVRQHAYTIPRGATDDLQENHKKFREHYPFGERLPFYPWTKPSVTLCNQNSYSNAEIFSHAYKTMDLGTLVGTPTFGAVISTGAERLVDGSYVRIPFRAWYVKKTNENMEHHGAVPDIIEYNSPDSKAKGEDPQLKKAVQELLSQIK